MPFEIEFRMLEVRIYCTTRACVGRSTASGRVISVCPNVVGSRREASIKARLRGHILGLSDVRGAWRPAQRRAALLDGEKTEFARSFHNSSKLAVYSICRVSVAAPLQGRERIWSARCATEGRRAEPGWGCGRSDARARPIVRVARISRNHAERSGTGGQRTFKEKKREPGRGKTRRIRIDDLDRAQLSAEPGRDPPGLEPRRPENSVRARILVLPTARGNSS